MTTITDWALWSLGILLMLYLIWLNDSREYSEQERGTTEATTIG
jgi:hypothetical protein